MKNSFRYALMIAVATSAFSARAEVLRQVKILGTSRIQDATVANYLGVKIGDDVSGADLDRAIKTLFSTGLFSDVDVQMKQGVATVKVVENPVIYEVFFEGNKALDDDVLKTC